MTTKTIAHGDLVEVTKTIPWANKHTPVGARLIVGSDPEPMEADEDHPDITGDGFTPQDPAGMWFGGDEVPVSHVKVIKSASDVLPSAKDIAKGLHMGILDTDESVVRVTEVGEQSEDGTTLYAFGTTPEGVRVSFLVKVGAVEVAE